MSENLTDKAKRLIEPALGTQEDPTRGKSNYTEGLRQAVNHMRAEQGIKGFDICYADPICAICKTIGTRVCDLVRTEIVNPVAEPVNVPIAIRLEDTYSQPK